MISNTNVIYYCRCAGLKGGALVSTLYTFTQHGNPVVKKLIKQLLSHAYQPLNAMLNSWIFDGELHDHYHEVSPLYTAYMLLYWLVIVSVFSVWLVATCLSWRGCWITGTKISIWYMAKHSRGRTFHRFLLNCKSSVSVLTPSETSWDSNV